MADSECVEVVKTGYLVKSPPLSRAPVSQWHKRWFELMDSRLVFPMAKRYVRLVYYQSEADAKSLADPKGTINLEECVGVVPHTDPFKNFKHVFDVCTKERVYHLSAETSEEKWAWISTLQGLLFPPKNRPAVQEMSRSTVVNDNGGDVVKRMKEGARPVRPHSFNPSSSGGGGKIGARPLPPVPGHVSSPVHSAGSPVSGDRKSRPLPSPPFGLSSSTPAIHIQPAGHQNTPTSSSRTSRPPPKPSPYRKNVSEPFPPLPTSTSEPLPLPRSNSFSPPHVLAQEYQEFVPSGQLSAAAAEYEQPAPLNLGMLSLSTDSTEDNYSLVSSVPRQQLPSAGLRVSPAGPRPPPSPKSSALQQKPTKLPKPANFPSRTAKSAAATPTTTSRPSRPVPVAKPRTLKPRGSAEGQVDQKKASSGSPARPKKNSAEGPVVPARTTSDSPVVSLRASCGSPVRPKRTSTDNQDYSVLEGPCEDYSVLESEPVLVDEGEVTQNDYSVIEDNYSLIEDPPQDYCTPQEARLTQSNKGSKKDHGNVKSQEHKYRNVNHQEQDYGHTDAEQDYGNVDIGQDYGNIDTEQNYGNVDTEQNYGNIDTEQDYGNVDTGQDYGNIDTEQNYGNVDTEQGYGNVDTTMEDYSMLHATKIPGYNPADSAYSHFTPVKLNGTEESPPPPLRHSSLATHHTSSLTSSHTPSHLAPTASQRTSDLSVKTNTRTKPPHPRRKPHPPKGGPDYANWPKSDDYSHLDH